MIELQHLRHMFGTLRAESVREIVSVENSEVKFLISDHPVTMFNAALPEGVPQLAAPLDPPLTWNGTQTLWLLPLRPHRKVFGMPLSWTVCFFFAAFRPLP